jgi:iron-sulfur cluster assembly protein
MTSSSPQATSNSSKRSLLASDPSPPEVSKPTGKGIGVSDQALAFAKQKLEARGTPEAAIRLGVKGGGCSGYQYVIEFSDDPPRSRDRVYEFDGVRFFIDKKSLIILAGSVLDYEKSLMFSGFKFKNPNEATACGCGHSFTVR